MADPSRVFTGRLLLGGAAAGFSPPDNILLLFHALRAAQIAAEMHISQSGGHGWVLGRPGSEVQAGPES